MGVVWVVTYPVPEGKSGQQTVEVLQRQVELLGATKTGNFSMECETFQSAQTPQKVMHLVHNSEQPATCFAVLDSGICLVADAVFDLLMMKLKGFYAPRKNARVESKGQKYELGDFTIKIGSVTLGQSQGFKGVLVEVEYCPCMVPSDCNLLVKELLQGFMGVAVEGPASHMKGKMDAIYTPTDTVMQYLEHFNNFKRTALPPTR